MEKKLTAQGPRDRKSYTVTLPLEWVKSHHLDKSKKVVLKMIGDRITISSRRNILEAEVVDGDIYQESLIKVLQGLYRLGVNEVKVKYRSPSAIQEIHSIINDKLIGYEIVENTSSYVLIQDITRESSEDFEVILRRIFLLLLELAGSKNEIQTKSIYNNISKLVNYCQRILVKWGATDYLKIPFYYNLLDQIEKLSDEYRWLLTLKRITRKELLHEINKCTRKAYELFYKFDPLEYHQYELITYNLKNQIRKGEKITVEEMHLHNLARILNSLYGNIFALKYTT